MTKLQKQMKFLYGPHLYRNLDKELRWATNLKSEWDLEVFVEEKMSHLRKRSVFAYAESEKFWKKNKHGQSKTIRDVLLEPSPEHYAKNSNSEASVMQELEDSFTVISTGSTLTRSGSTW